MADRKVTALKDHRRDLDKSGGPPNDGGMEARIAKLEDFAVEVRDRMTRVETRLEATATKADLHEGLHSVTWKIIGWTTGLGIALVSAVFFIAKYVS